MAFTNLYLDTLQSTYTSGDTELEVSDASPLTAPVYLIIFDRRYGNAANAYNSGRAEIVLCTSIATNTLTVTRGQGGTSAIAFDSSGDWNVVATLTADDILDEDNMSSDSPDALATQQSIKAYADTKADLSGGNTFSGDQQVDGTLIVNNPQSGQNVDQAEIRLMGTGGNYNKIVQEKATANDDLNLYLYTLSGGSFVQGMKIPANGSRIEVDGISFDGGTNVLDYYKQGRLESVQITIADDGVYTFTDVSVRCLIFAWLVKSTVNTAFMNFQIGASLPKANIISQDGALFEATTSGTAPTGTTGTDGKITFFTGDSNNKLHVENREGSSRTLNLFFLEEI